jgi:hypothetical protein
MSIRRSIAALCAAAAVAVLATPALAHEEHSQGDLVMEAGFGIEPAYAGQPNSVQLVLIHDGEPVVDLGDTLAVEVTFGEDSIELPLEPNFVVGEFGEPGDYRAWFVPTRPGQYSFRFFGKVEGEEVDETFTSGPDTFSDVVSMSDAAFPTVDPTNGELAERIDQEIPRITGQIDELRAELAAGDEASAEAAAAAEDAESAATLALIGIAIGAAGLALGIAALVIGRKRARAA